MDNKSNSISRLPKVAVLCGGIGDERQISLQSGQYVYQSLNEAGYETILADIQPDSLDILEDQSIDVFFLAMHGRFGEDGQLQQILEDKSLCYTGSGPEACRVAFNKMKSKKIFTDNSINTPAAITVDVDTDIQHFEKKLEKLACRFVIKPLKQGSSVGISIVDTAQQAIDRARETAAKFDTCMIENFIPGREITVGILCGQALPIIEIRPNQQFYNYFAKYSDDKTLFLFDTIKDAELKKQIETTALRCFKVLGLRDFARVDFILSDNQQLYVLEVNTIPGLTTHSLLPMAAAKEHISMSQLCTKIIEAAMESRKVNSISQI